MMPLYEFCCYFSQTRVQIDDTFLAAYQASYGVPQPETTPTDPTIPAIPTPVQTQGPTGPPGQQNTSEEKVSSSFMGISSPMVLHGTVHELMVTGTSPMQTAREEGVLISFNFRRCITNVF